jgi:RNA polymerase sigma factor (sigma-70 family)
MRDHIAILYRVANAFAWGADRHDLMQELLLAVWKAAPDFRGEAKASTFLYRVSHNTAMTWQRTERNYRRRIDRFAEQGGLLRAPGPTDAERDRLERVYAAIRALPPLDRSHPAPVPGRPQLPGDRRDPRPHRNQRRRAPEPSPVPARPRSEGDPVMSLEEVWNSPGNTPGAAAAATS